MKKKRLLAVALALTMAMPMTAMAAQRQIPLGEFMTVYSASNDRGTHEVAKFEVLDAATFYGTTATLTGVPILTDEQIRVLQGAMASLAPTHDIYYVRVSQQNSWGVGYGSVINSKGIEVDGQRFTFAAADPTTYFVVDEDSKWWSQADIDAQWAAGGFVATSASGRCWPITINGQGSQVLIFGTLLGEIYAVPKAASSVKVVYGVSSSTPGGNFDRSLFNGVDPGITDYDNGYYFDLKVGQASGSQAATMTWKLDVKGWRVEKPDGTYLQNEWYESNGQWYYMGADGYMLTNTTTPDGYTVNADGVWVH